MRVRFGIKLNSQLGLVQEQRASIVGFLFKEEDRLRYDQAAAGELFRPRYQPAGIWLDVDDFEDSPIWEEALPYVQDAASDSRAEQAKRAKGLLLFDPVEAEFTWRSSEPHAVRRTGFPLTHARFLTSTSAQGQTIRTGVTIDCARLEQQGPLGMKDANFLRAACLVSVRKYIHEARVITTSYPSPSIHNQFSL